MPQNNQWLQTLQHCWFKPQDYNYSCFSACLQIALVNFRVIASEGRVIEDEFNQFMITNNKRDIDNQAPGIDDVNSFLFTGFTGKNDIAVDHISCVQPASFGYINRDMQKYVNYAIIGALKTGGGHALSLVKIGANYFEINPNGTVEDVSHSTANPMQSSEDGAAIRFPNIGFIDYCYLIH